MDLDRLTISLWKLRINFKKNVSPFCRKSAVVSQATNLITFLSNLAQCVERFSESALKYFNSHSFFTRHLWKSQAWWINIVKLQCDYLKSSFSEKSTKIWKLSHFFWRYWVKTTVLSKQVGIFFKFWGLPIISEL